MVEKWRTEGRIDREEVSSCESLQDVHVYKCNGRRGSLDTGVLSRLVCEMDARRRAVRPRVSMIGGGIALDSNECIAQDQIGISKSC